MKYILFYIVGVIIGVSIAYGIYIFNNPINNTKLTPEVTIAPTQDNTYTIEEPPKDSIKGKIATKSGALLFESRTATQPAEMRNVDMAQQGERFITREDGLLSLAFENLGTISLSTDSDLSLIQTLPTNFVVEQKAGVVDYENIGKVPLSVRIRSAVISKLNAGVLQIKMTAGDPIIIISPVAGDVKIGFNDLDYVSQVFTLRSGEVYEYNSDERTAINIKSK